MTNHIPSPAESMRSAEIFRVSGDSRELVVDAWKRLSNVRLAASAMNLETNLGNFHLHELVLDMQATLDVIDTVRQAADSDELPEEAIIPTMNRYLRQARIMACCLKHDPLAQEIARETGDNLGAVHELLRDAAGPVRVLAEQLAKEPKPIAPISRVAPSTEI